MKKQQHHQHHQKSKRHVVSPSRSRLPKSRLPKSRLHRWIANPKRFVMSLSKIQPWAGWGALVTIGLGWGWGLFLSPPDYLQGQYVRIMYVHVPAAWMSLLCYSIMFVSSLAYMVGGNILMAWLTRASVVPGACFTLLCLVTGSLWGYPTWGTWWVWDARLTSVLVLFFMYLGYWALTSGKFARPVHLKRGAILVLVGFINIPIIKGSVEWWNTLHQPASLIKSSGPSIHHTMLWPLLIVFIGFILYYIYIGLIRLRIELLQQQYWALKLQQRSPHAFHMTRNNQGN